MSRNFFGVEQVAKRIQNGETDVLDSLLVHPTKESSEILLELLQQARFPYRIHAPIFKTLVKRKALKPLVYLRSQFEIADNYRLQAFAIGLLNDFLNEEGVIPLLVDILYAENQLVTREIRNQAAYTLARLKTDEGLYPLAVALNYGDNDEVRNSAAYALSMVNYPPAVTVLLHHLESLLADGTNLQDVRLLWRVEPILDALHRVVRRQFTIPDLSYARSVLSKWLYAQTFDSSRVVEQIINRLPDSMGDEVIYQWQQWHYAFVESQLRARIFP